MQAVPEAERPTYTAAEAARYTGISAPSVARWRVGYQYPTTSGPKKSPRITAGSTSGLLSFNDLIEIAVVAAARKANVPMKAVRAAVATAAELYGVDRPLIEIKFKHNGREIFTEEKLAAGKRRFINLSGHGQVAWEHIAAVLEELDYRGEQAYRWWPAGRDDPIVINPEVSFGRPYIVGKRVSTDAIASRFGAKETLEDIVDDLEVTKAEAEAALRFELSLRAA